MRCFSRRKIGQNFHLLAAVARRGRRSSNTCRGPMTKEKFRLVSFLGRLSGDERGSILIQFTITSVAILGMIGLALDGGRLLMLHSDLQALADAAALAGAAKLDGTANAITNADA